MPDSPVARWVMSQGEPAQYAVYFLVLASFGLWEAVRPGRAAVPRRFGRWPANFGLTVLNVIMPPIVPLSGLALAQWAEVHQFGLLNFVALGTTWHVAGTLLGRSLASYVTHYLMHRVPLLWRLHRVHHSDTMLDVSTTVRFHPLEFVPGLLVQLPLIALFGLSAWVLVVYELLDIAVNVITHANIRLPARLSRTLELLWTTPAVHQIHHSAASPETNSNYGAVFTVWDRLFKTFRSPSTVDLDGITIGLDEIRGTRARSFGYQLLSPFFNRYEDGPASATEPDPAPPDPVARRRISSRR